MQTEDKLFNEYEKNPEELLNQIVRAKKIKEKIEVRLKKSKEIRKETVQLAQQLKKQALSLESSIQGKILALTKMEKTTTRGRGEKSIEIAKGLSEINLPRPADKKYESLLELFTDLDIELSEELSKAIQLIDEKFVQATADNKKHYYELLNDFKEALTEEIS